jgi:hypothetical protein
MTIIGYKIAKKENGKYVGFKRTDGVFPESNPCVMV